MFNHSLLINKAFILKVTLKDDSFAWNLQRDEFLQA